MVQQDLIGSSVVGNLGVADEGREVQLPSCALPYARN